MVVLIAYTTKHGSTQGIAERIESVLESRDLVTELRPLSEVSAPESYDAFVIGGPTYLGSWLEEATKFVLRNAVVLKANPVWLFCNGPLGSGVRDASGRDPRVVARPTEFADLEEAIGPRDTMVFFGALDANQLELREQLTRSQPAGRGLLPEGDFRDWPAIEAWAASIADVLTK